jgi:CheY-like chemotaxis protein
MASGSFAYWLGAVAVEVLPVFALASASQERNSNYPRLVGKKILVVDDEAVICVDYWFQLREIGARPEGFVPSRRAALDFLETHPVDAVILDYRLRDGTSEPLMAWLCEHKVPYVVVSGWVEKVGRQTTTEHPILEKPALANDLWQALSGVMA